MGWAHGTSARVLHRVVMCEHVYVIPATVLLPRDGDALGPWGTWFGDAYHSDLSILCGYLRSARGSRHPFSSSLGRTSADGRNPPVDALHGVCHRKCPLEAR